MLGKLFKYDFKWIIKVLLVIYTILIFTAICTRLVGLLEKTVIVTIIEQVLSGTFFSLIASTFITCLMRIWARFMTNTYKDESYLTHTLPVTKNQIFNSKILASILSIVCSLLVCLIGAFIVFWNDTTWISIKTLFNNISDIFSNSNSIFIVVAFIFILILEFIYIAQSGIFGIVVGFRGNNHKVLRSILIAILSYGILSGSMLVILFIFAQINPTMMELYKTELPSPDAFKFLIYTSFIIYIVYNLIYYFVSKKIFNKGVNID